MDNMIIESNDVVVYYVRFEMNCDADAGETLKDNRRFLVKALQEQYESGTLAGNFKVVDTLYVHKKPRGA